MSKETIEIKDLPTDLGARSGNALRGDYANVASDFTAAQNWHTYTDAEHDRWRRLFARQYAMCEQYAAEAFLDGLRKLDCADAIPDFAHASKTLRKATGWELVAVPGFIPDDQFFAHLAERRFPVTRWIREEHELDYLVEPDVFHDFFGHVPLLLNPAFADFMQKYGAAGERALAMNALPMLARIYWYNVEFGLIEENGPSKMGGLKAFGAGILSSAGETVYATTSPLPSRLRFDPVRIMRTDYAIDDFQRVYFVINSFDELVEQLVGLDFGPIYDTWRDEPPVHPDDLLPDDRIVSVGKQARLPSFMTATAGAA